MKKAVEGTVAVSRRGRVMQVKPEQVKAGDVICARTEKGSKDFTPMRLRGASRGLRQ